MDMRAMVVSCPTKTGTQPLSHWCTELSCTLSMRGMLGPHRSTSRIPTWGQVQPLRQAQQSLTPQNWAARCMSTLVTAAQQPHLKHKWFKFHVPPDLLLPKEHLLVFPSALCQKPSGAGCTEHSKRPSGNSVCLLPIHFLFGVLELTHFTPQSSKVVSQCQFQQQTLGDFIKFHKREMNCSASSSYLHWITPSQIAFSQIIHTKDTHMERVGKMQPS